MTESAGAGFVARTWTSHELPLHARDYAGAEGPARLPVICLHGLTRNSRDFEDVAPWIAAMGRRVLAIDVRGRGRSAYDPEARYHLDAYTRDVLALLDALGIGRALFVGTSMGGLITMELAAAAGERIAGAVINDIGPELAPAGLARIASYVGQGGSMTSWAAAAEHLRRLNEASLPHYGTGEWLAMARRMFREEEGGFRADYDPEIARPFGAGPLMADPWERWAALANGRPVLLLRGNRSDLLDAAVAARMAERPGVTFAEVPDVGHAPMLDEPASQAAIAAFFADLP